MKIETAHPFSGFWYVLLLAILAAAFAMMVSRPAARSGREPAATALSFDMWCLEMQLYSSSRCDEHRPDDRQAYEKYRASLERYEADKIARAARDAELQRRLNPASPATGTNR